jgi:hypothetical protein
MEINEEVTKNMVPGNVLSKVNYNCLHSLCVCDELTILFYSSTCFAYLVHIPIIGCIASNSLDSMPLQHLFHICLALDSAHLTECLFQERQAMFG